MNNNNKTEVKLATCRGKHNPVPWLRFTHPILFYNLEAIEVAVFDESVCVCVCVFVTDQRESWCHFGGVHC